MDQIVIANAQRTFYQNLLLFTHVALFCCGCSAGFHASSPLNATVNRGDLVRCTVDKNGTEQVFRARFATLDSDGVFHFSDPAFTIPFGSVVRLEVFRGVRSQRWSGIAIAAPIGAAIGAVIGHARGDDPSFGGTLFAGTLSKGSTTVRLRPESDDGEPFPFSAEDKAIIGGVLGAGIGAAIGALVGSRHENERWTPVRLTSIRATYP